MTNRERAMNILHFRDADRLPAVHFGYWRDLLYEWAAQGKISREIAVGWRDANEYDRELDKIIGWDFDWSTNRSCNMGLFPAFEHKVLETLPDGSQVLKCTKCGEVLDTKGAEDEEPSIVGDVNLDGKVNMFDYILVKNVCLQ